MSYSRKTAENREFRHGMRGESARRCIGPVKPGCEIMGLTKGDFSMIDILAHLLNECGVSDVVVGTWTAAHADVTKAEAMLKNGKLKSFRMLADRSFPNRQPKYFDAVIRSFGVDSIRLARFHAKFILVKGGGMHLVCRTSMNLNENKRIELYEISDDERMYGYFDSIVSEHFAAPLEDSWDQFKSMKLETSGNATNHNQQQRLGGWD